MLEAAGVQTFVAAGAGFLLAVLWFDLMFDVQMRPHRNGPVPVEVLASISRYYRRVTTDARPMNRLIALFMLWTAAGVAAEVLRHDGPAWARWSSIPLIVAPVVLAGRRTVPNAVRLGARSDASAVQASLARGILRDHVLCFAAIGLLVAVQLVSAAVQ